MRNEPRVVDSLSAVIFAFRIFATLGMSPEKLRCFYRRKQKDFEKRINSELFKNVLRLRKKEKEEEIAPLWEISDERFWNDSYPDPRHYVLATSQLRVFMEETNVIFFFVDNKLCSIFVAPWKRIVNPEMFAQELKKSIIWLVERNGEEYCPYVKKDMAENLAWDERQVYRWEDIEGNSLQLKIYFKEQQPDGFEILAVSEKFKNRYMDG